MRKPRPAVLAIAPALVVALAGVLNTAPAQAAFAGYAASDVLGQLDGSGNPDFTTSNSGVSATNFDYPTGSTVDTIHHRLFVGNDGGNGLKIRIFNLDNNNDLIDHAADNIIGQTDFTSSDSGTTQSVGMWEYLGVIYDSTTNRLYVSDEGNTRILVFDLSNGITNGMGASYVLGQPDFTSNGTATAQNGFGEPGGLALDTVHQQLFAADYGSSRVLVFNVDPLTIANGENALHVLGQPDFTSSTQNTTQNGLNRSQDVVFNANTSQLFVADCGNASRVMVFDLANGINDGMNASYVLGQPDFTTNNSTPTQSGVEGCVDGLGLDTTRNVLYVDDDQGNRVLVYDLSHGISNGMNASLVLGQPDFTTDTANTTQTGINDPEGTIAVDSASNRIYVTDSNNNRVLIYNFAKLASSLNDPAVGDSYSQWMGSQFQGTPTFSVTAGSLPPGLSLDSSSGLLSGTFTQAGTFNFTIQLVDNNGTAGSFTDTHSYSLVVDPAVAAAGAATLSNTGLNVGISGGVAVTLLVGAVFVYRKRSHLYRLWGWEP